MPIEREPAEPTEGPDLSERRNAWRAPDADRAFGLDPGHPAEAGPRAESLRAQLAQAVRDGDAERSGQLLAAHVLPLARDAAKWARIVGMDVDDLLSEIYLRAWSHLTRTNGYGAHAFHGYLRGIGRNVALQAEARRARERSYAALDEVEAALGASDESLTTVEEDECRHALEQRLSRLLPSHYLEALKLNSEGCRLGEIADALGKPVPACRDILRHAKHVTRRKLDRPSGPF